MDDQSVFGVDPKATGLTPLHFLRHFYYGGIVYIGTKRWKDALDSFLMVSVITPSDTRAVMHTRVQESLASACTSLFPRPKLTKVGLICVWSSLPAQVCALFTHSTPADRTPSPAAVLYSW